jgi:hypothetical protein
MLPAVVAPFFWIHSALRNAGALLCHRPFAVRSQVRAKQRREVQLEEALLRFHATADRLSQEAFRTHGSKRVLQTVCMDLMTSEAVRCHSDDELHRCAVVSERLLGCVVLACRTFHWELVREWLPQVQN